MEILSPTPFSHSGIYDGVNPLPTMRPIKMTTMPCPNENKKPQLLRDSDWGQRFVS